VGELDTEWNLAGERNTLDKDRFNLVSSLILQKGKKFIDVGACRGDYINMAREYIPLQSIYAFEPIPFMFKHLELTFPGANLFNAAVSDHGRLGEFYVSNNEELSGLVERDLGLLPSGTIFEKIVCSIVTIDQVIENKRNIGLIKIDVEGNELAVLNGSEKLISLSRPTIYCEWGTNGPENYRVEPDSLFDWSQEFNYNIKTIDGQNIRDRDQFLDSFFNWPIWNYLLTPKS
jgi:FkbM family methyltransferase